MKRVAVVGLGNILMGDDSAGVRVIQELEKRGDLPQTVMLVQAGTAGITILPYLEEADITILVDAVNFDAKFGEVRVFRENEIDTNRTPVLSMHEVGMEDLVSLIRLMSSGEMELLLVGIRPKCIARGLETSPEVGTGIEEAARIVVEEIKRFA